MVRLLVSNAPHGRLLEQHQWRAIACPAKIRFADALPKTRSGKIIRRFLRNLAKLRQGS